MLIVKSAKATNTRSRTYRPKLDYIDTTFSIRLHEQMVKINSFFSAASSRVNIMGSDQRRMQPFRPFVRIFAAPPGTPHGRPFPSDPEHGRHYWGVVGGRHQNLPKNERHLILIDQEPIVLIDLASLHVRLAYAEAGLEPPRGDLYDVHPALRSHRDGVKRLAAATLSRDGALQVLANSRKLGLFPKDWTAAMVSRAIKLKHPRIVHILDGSARSLTYMRKDADLMTATLLALADHNIVGLPLFDGLLVKRSVAGAVKAILRECSRRIAGMELPVSITPYAEA